jgi:hypothetical protein
VPDDTVRAQHNAMVHAHQGLAAEGFNHVVFADSLYRLEPYLRRLSEARLADLGLDGGDGLGEHPVGHGPQVGAVCLESFRQKIVLVHRSHSLVAIRQSSDE